MCLAYVFGLCGLVHTPLYEARSCVEGLVDLLSCTSVPAVSTPCLYEHWLVHSHSVYRYLVTLMACPCEDMADKISAYTHTLMDWHPTVVNTT